LVSIGILDGIPLLDQKMAMYVVVLLPCWLFDFQHLGFFYDQLSHHGAYGFLNTIFFPNMTEMFP
jgi:hypothetical protein